MALTEETKVDKMEILEDGVIQVREATIIYKDGVEKSRTFRRYVLDPGAQGGNVEVDDARVQAVKDAVWTERVVAEREATLEATHTRG